MKPMDKSIFEHSDYRSYLEQKLGKAGQRTGLRAQAAAAVGCHTTYLSQVMNDRADLSPEQSESMNQFLGHTETEAEFFHLLVGKARAGTRPLKLRLQSQIEKILGERSQVGARLGQQAKIRAEDRERFYSTWIHGAIHVLATIPEFQSIDALERKLKIPRKRLGEAVEFLVGLGILNQASGKLTPGKNHIHLGDDSASIVHHHTQWRLHALRSLETRRREDVHYSAVVTLSSRDVARVRERMLDFLKESISTIEASPAEEAHVLCLDWYPLT